MLSRQRQTMRQHICYTVLMTIMSGSLMAAGGSQCLNAPNLAAPSGNIVSVMNVAELQLAIDNLQDDTTVLIEPGDYFLNQTLYIQ